MNLVKIHCGDELFSKAVESAEDVLANRITYPWQEDLLLRRKWNTVEEGSKKILMKETCFIIDGELIELLHPIMEEEPKCKVTFGQGNLQTLSLVLKFKLTDMKITGNMRTYSSSKPCKTFPYELFLKDVEFKITAGLIIRGDSFCVENYANDYLNFNLILSYKNKDESNETFPLNKIQDSTLRKSIEKYIMEKLTKDIIIAVEDRIGEECVDASVSSMLDNEYSYRNKLRLHKKKITNAFRKLATEIVGMVNNELKNKKLAEIILPDLHGKLLEKNNERGNFEATDGFLKSLASLQQLEDITIHREGENIILFVFLYFSTLDIVYKNLSIKRKDYEQTRMLEVPENSNSSYIKIKIEKVNNDKVNLTLLDYGVEDLGYIEVNWDEPENDLYKRHMEPEVAMWLNYTLEYIITPIIEERIKNSVKNIINHENLIPLILHPEVMDEYDSDPLNEEEINEDEDEDENNDDNDLYDDEEDQN